MAEIVTHQNKAGELKQKSMAVPRLVELFDYCFFKAFPNERAVFDVYLSLYSCPFPRCCRLHYFPFLFS